MAAAALTRQNVTLHDDILVTVSLLQFECDVDTVSEFKGGIVVVYKPSIFEEWRFSRRRISVRCLSCC
jgi:hypothetical protein